jgi:glycosyltransferase involved in cell wall biosynthesis
LVRRCGADIFPIHTIGRDILRDGETGIVMQDLGGNSSPGKKFDPVEVANAIERLTGDPAMYQRIANFNWQYARDRFAAPVVAKRLEAIYQSVLADAPARSKSAKPLRAE